MVATSISHKRSRGVEIIFDDSFVKSAVHYGVISVLRTGDSFLEGEDIGVYGFEYYVVVSFGGVHAVLFS